MSEKNLMPEIPPTRGDDLHGLELMAEADLVLFMAGNQFMVMDDLLGRFRTERPEIQSISFETLPPGLELRQILAGGAMFRGTLVTGRPDVYTSVSPGSMSILRDEGLIDRHVVYLHNRLILMVAEGNPMGIRGIEDLARDNVRVSQPGEMEDISSHIRDMYIDAGGEALFERIVEQKRSEGLTQLTLVHHRETPLRLMKNTVDAGPVWATELEYARRSGMAVEGVEPGEGLDQRSKVNYCATVMKDAPNPENARLFMDFLLSREAQAIYAAHGFIPGSGEA